MEKGERRGERRRGENVGMVESEEERENKSA